MLIKIFKVTLLCFVFLLGVGNVVVILVAVLIDIDMKQFLAES